MPDVETIAAVRRFNRFYTRQIGVLRRTYLGSPYSLGEMRVLYELATGARTASDIMRALDLDAGYLSRVLRNFERQGFISRKRSKEDARQSEISLTAAGRKMFAPFEKRTQEQVADMLKDLQPPQHARLVHAMGDIEMLLREPAEAAAPNYNLRAPKIGDYGWMVLRHAELYWQEYRWGEPFEGRCAQIVADFANKNDPARERCWIAEMECENVGCVMLVKEADEIARLRLLLVDPKARGLGVGARLLEECVKFARYAGYKSITLWTHSVLLGARHIYEKAGFHLTSSEPRRTWGQDLVEEFWDLEL
jgi:DNA-binding MarR family transcriptional regulator/N-acetylglutamate synthase-like GNAT family acetyltransferase